MASIVAAISAASTIDDQASITTAPFTPQAGDLLIAIGLVTNGTAGSVVDSQNLGGGSWPGIGITDKNSDQDTVQVCIANDLAAAVPTTITFALGGDNHSSGIVVCVLRVSGMSKVGFNALRQILSAAGFNFGSELNRLGGTVPTPSFTAAPLASNPLIGGLMTGANPTGAIEPSGWTKQFDVGYDAPSTGLEVVSIDEGFTSQPVAWGSLVAEEFCDFVIELDASEPAIDPGMPKYPGGAEMIRLGYAASAIPSGLAGQIIGE